MLTIDLNKLKNYRQSKMTLQEMAFSLGYQSANGYYYLECGRSKISAETLAKVATVLNVPIQDFFSDQDHLIH
ncbi:helix-turn-helix domain-containing protein [Sporolactobacillus kofuensis]|uniref:Helix-turn-helix domain-containing protein n=1 Tax=Sporolactobacillus kofuensis TaxID=269672 RepID=A0ABW1WGW2_9BACL|nr:helix-turn-helix transcriptional regulator [Sporolactobacillus kofuensis]MCO7176032.1 helix-turn-helix transcriptional regulator [Sporolactobacillus kofuensis]